MINIVDLLVSAGIHPEKVSAHEWHSACPECCGTDRLSIFPEQVNRNGQYFGGRFVCRQCGTFGDGVSFLMKRHGLSFHEACRQLGVESVISGCKTEGQWQPKPPASEPGPVWMEKAKSFLPSCQKQLSDNQEVMNWLRTERGLTAETVQKCGIGWNPDDVYQSRQSWGLSPELNHKTGEKKRLWLPAGIVIPFFNKSGDVVRLRIRRTVQDKYGRYVVISGSSTVAMSIWDTQNAVAIVESELDAILLQQEAGELIGVIATGSAQLKPDSELHYRLMNAGIVLSCLDSDTAGISSSWKFWNRYPGYKRWPVISGKDICEQWKAGIPVREWIQAGLPESKTMLPAIRKSNEPINPEWITHCEYLKLIATNSDRFDDYEERLSILMFDGQLSEHEAEKAIISIR